MPLTSLLSVLQVTGWVTSATQSVLFWRELPKVETNQLSFTAQWHSLGPFQIGTREAIWGADPLEALGGFESIPYNKSMTFRSSLATNATIAWTEHNFSVEQESSVATTIHVEVGYPDVDWNFFQSVYGWPGLQFQAWTRGSLVNHANISRKALIYPQGILEFSVNGQRYFGGDFYSFNRAPVVVSLRPGRNDVAMRLIRDVRASGGTAPPMVACAFRAQIADEDVFVDTANAILPDLVDGKLPSPYISIPILNLREEMLEIYSCMDSKHGHASLLSPTPIRIVSGQMRPVAFDIQALEPQELLQIRLCYKNVRKEAMDHGQENHYLARLHLKQRSIDEAHKFTFLHPSGTVSYALLRSPQHNETAFEESLPLLIHLHGAGVDADSSLVRHALDGIQDLHSFVLFPNGMSPWSGDDWHTWGLADVNAAIAAVHDWTKRMSWQGSLPLTEHVLISGHSNGGQGTWFFATHQPDRVVAAAPVSGYTSIENYVPFTLWNKADPLQDAMLNIARNNFRHELLLENLKYVPVLQQHGSADDNVPAYHSRLMSQLSDQLDMSLEYHELPGKGHWFEGVMSTQPLRDFYRKHLTKPRALTRPYSFSVIAPDSHEMGAKLGVTILQLQTPDRLGRADIEVSEQNGQIIWSFLHLVNIRYIGLNFSAAPSPRPHSLHFDNGQEPLILSSVMGAVTLVQDHNEQWTHADLSQEDLGVRIGPQRGPLDAILRTRSAFQIVSCVDHQEIPVQTARNLLQYFGADSSILSCDSWLEALLSGGNVITIATGSDVPPSILDRYPIRLTRTRIDIEGLIHRYSSFSILFEAGMGGVFLRPLPDKRLELLVWGYDVEGLQQAARLIPTLAGAGQPDFVILGRQAKWQGHAGTLSMGFLNHAWNVSGASYLR